MADTPFQHDIVIQQGADQDIDFIRIDGGSPFDYTNYTAQAQIRLTNADAPGSTVLLDLTSAASEITFDNATGRLRLVLTDTDTIALGTAVGSDTALYDIELTNTVTGKITKFARGKVTIEQEITR